MSTNKPMPYRKRQSTPATQITCRIKTATFRHIEKLAKSRNKSVNFIINDMLDAVVSQ